MKIKAKDINGATTAGYVLTSNGTTVSWAAPTGGGSSAVTSVAGKTGAVTLVKADITDFPVLATVSTSGSYNDLSNKPTTIAQRVLVTTASGTYTCNWANYDVIEVTISANTTFTFSGAVSGQKCLLKIKQDATGSRTVTLPSSVRFGTDVTSYTATTTASKKDYVGFVYDSADAKYDLLAINKDF